MLCKNRSQPISSDAEHSGHVLVAFIWSSVTVTVILSLRLSSLGWSLGSKYLQQPAAISTESLLCFPLFETGINTLTALLLNKCFQEMFECGLRGITTSPCYLQTKMMRALKVPFLLPLAGMNALSWGLSFLYSTGAIVNSWCPRWIRAWIYPYKLLWNVQTALAAFSSILNAFFVPWFQKELIVSCSASHQWNQLA